MTVKYINEDYPYISFTLNKIYYVIEEYNVCYKLNDDRENIVFATKVWFKPLHEIRDEIINKII